MNPYAFSMHYAYMFLKVSSCRSRGRSVISSSWTNSPEDNLIDPPRSSTQSGAFSSDQHLSFAIQNRDLFPPGLCTRAAIIRSKSIFISGVCKTGLVTGIRFNDRMKLIRKLLQELCSFLFTNNDVPADYWQHKVHSLEYWMVSWDFI